MADITAGSVLSWSDRLSAFRRRSPAENHPGQRGSSPEPPCAAPHPGEIQRWRAAVDPWNAGLFARRLAWGGLDDADLDALLAGAAAPLESPPDWWPELIEMCAGAGSDRCPKTGDPAIPFADLLAPLAAWNLEKLREVAGFLPEAGHDLSTALLQRLSTLCAGALEEDFARTRTAGRSLLLRFGISAEAEEHGTGVYDSWCRKHLSDGLSTLFGKYPVLCRVIAVSCRQWRMNAAALLRRIHADRALLERRFGIPAMAPLTGVAWGLSDPHRGGQSVALLTFGGSGYRVVYKPKDMQIEKRYQDLVAATASWIGDPSWAPLVIAPCGSEYGYASFAEHRPCANADERRAFYRNAGRLLALLHLLGATDAHAENIIAEGPMPHLVDAETLFQNSRPAPLAAEDIRSGPLDTRFGNSALRVGLLPVWTIAGDQQKAYDISALGIDSVVAATRLPGWMHINTDDMTRTYVARRKTQPSSLPVPEGVSNPLPCHVAELEGGFEEFYRVAMQRNRRDHLLAAVASFAGVTRRLVLRATRVYGIVQEKALRAPALADANARGFILEQLSRSSLQAPEKNPAWQLFEAELHDMENLDIPYFDYPLGSTAVHASTGKIDGLLAGNGLEEAKERIQGMSEHDLSWQKRLIRGAVHARYRKLSASNDLCTPVKGTLPSSAASGWAELSEHLLAELERSACDGDSGQRTWLTFSRLPDGERVQLGLIGDGLYDGRAGLALFQLIMAGLRDDLSRYAAAKSTLAPVHKRLQHPDPYARFCYIRDQGLGWSGIGGILRLLLIPRGIKTSRNTVDGAKLFDRLLGEISDELIRRDRNYDFIGGVAGLIGPVARRHTAAPGDRSAGILRAAAEHLIASQKTNGGWLTEWGDRPLTGLSHGASGMGLALLEAGVALSDGRLVDAAVRAFDYEHTLLDETAGNWPDLRIRPGTAEERLPFMVAWCHGAPGIGLTRLRALELLPGHPRAAVWRHELEMAMGLTAAAPIAANDTLCCGNLGRAATLHMAGLSAGRAGWVSEAVTLTGRVVDRAKLQGGFSMPPNDPDSAAPPPPGLMTGISGIGAHLASLETGSGLQEVLL